MLKGGYLSLSTWQKDIGNNPIALHSGEDNTSIKSMANSIINNKPLFDYIEKQKLETETLKQELIDKNLW